MDLFLDMSTSIPAAFREAHASLKAMVEAAEQRRKEARAIANATQRQPPPQQQQQQPPPQQQQGAAAWECADPPPPPSSEEQRAEHPHFILSAPPLPVAVVLAGTGEDRLLRSLLRRACPLVRRKGKILHELQVREIESIVLLTQIHNSPVLTTDTPKTKTPPPAKPTPPHQQSNAQEKRANMSHSGLVRITDFAFLRPICQGAFAHVYLARKVQTGRLYAVKVRQADRTDRPSSSSSDATIKAGSRQATFRLLTDTPCLYPY